MSIIDWWDQVINRSQRITFALTSVVLVDAMKPTPCSISRVGFMAGPSQSCHRPKFFSSLDRNRWQFLFLPFSELSPSKFYSTIRCWKRRNHIWSLGYKSLPFSPVVLPERSWQNCVSVRFRAQARSLLTNCEVWFLDLFDQKALGEESH